MSTKHNLHLLADGSVRSFAGFSQKSSHFIWWWCQVMSKPPNNIQKRLWDKYQVVPGVCVSLKTRNRSHVMLAFEEKSNLPKPLLNSSRKSERRVCIESHICINYVKNQTHDVRQFVVIKVKPHVVLCWSSVNFIVSSTPTWSQLGQKRSQTRWTSQ